jgi:hypothetical protein
LPARPGDKGRVAKVAIGASLEGKTERQKNPHAKGSLAWLS